MSNQVGDCFKFVWPFQKLRTLQHTTGQINGPDFKSSKIDFMVNVGERSLQNKPSLQHQFVYAFGQNSEKYGVHQRTTPSIYKLTSTYSC